MPIALFIAASKKLILSALLIYTGVTGTGEKNPVNPSQTDPKSTSAAASGTSIITASSLKGIDVSRWQQEVDWDLVKEADISFSFIKATQNDFRLDPYFYRNWGETKRVGIKRGAYHYFIPNAPVQGQIAIFTSTVTLEPGDMPPVLDVEEVAPNMSGEELRLYIRTWLEGVTQHYGIKPIIYTNQTYYRRWLKGHFQDYHFWIARYNTIEPEIDHTDKWMFWQHTDKGTIPGINVAVDLNLFVGDWEKLYLLCLPDFMASEENPTLMYKHLQPLP